MLVVIVDIIVPGRDELVHAIAIGGLVVTAVAVVVAGPLLGQGALPATGQQLFPDAVGNGVYVRDALTAFLDLLFILIAGLTLLYAIDYLKPRGLPMAEFTATLLFAISGAMLLGGARDLLILFLGLELLVLPATCWPVTRSETACRPRAPSNTSCWAASPARSCWISALP